MAIIRRNFTGKWIWADSTRKVNDHVLFRADFDLTELPSRTSLYLAAESFAIVYINGQLVCQGSSLSYPTQHYYEQYDISEYLQAGKNQLAIVAWYIGVPSGASCPKDPGLLFDIVTPAGDVILASDDDRLLCQRQDAWLDAQRRSFWLNLDLVETVDYRLLADDFPTVADLSDFKPTWAVDGANVRYVDLQLRDFPKPNGQLLDGMNELFRGEIEDKSADCDIAHLAVVAEQNECISACGEPVPLASDFIVAPLDTGKAYCVLIDMGNYEKGLPLLTVSGCDGASVDISWFEQLKPLNAAETVSKVYVSDRYILPERSVDIRPEEWKCGRYLRLTFRNVIRELTVKNLRWQRQHYPLGSKFKFTSSDEKLNSIVDICINAAALCMHDNIMDCPWRERRQWIGDVQRIGLLNHYVFGDKKLVRASLAQHVHMQDVNGRMYSCMPIYEEYPTQSMEWLRAVLEYNNYTGDRSLIDEVGDNIEMLHRWFCREQNTDDNGLLRIITRPVMNWMDNPFGSVTRPSGSIRANQFRTAFCAMNLRYLLFLDDIAEVMFILGRHRVADTARAKREQLAEIIVRVFMQGDTGLLRECALSDIEVSHSELSHALAVLADLPSVDTAQLWDNYRCCAANPGDVNFIDAGPFGKYCTLEALGKLGRTDELISEILKWWGPMVDSGSQTAWEHFDGGGSQCHGWGGSPIIAMVRYIFGVSPITGGLASCENVGGIAKMSCEITGN